MSIDYSLEKINVERVFKLADTLESGKYKQGFGGLEHTLENGEVKNCCLGVATRVAMEEGLVLAVKYSVIEDVAVKEIVEKTASRAWTNFNGYISMMPGEVRDYYGFSSCDPILPPIDVESSYNHAVYLNDHKLKSFYEIGQRFRLLAEMAQKYQSEALDSGYAGYQHQQDPDEVGYQSFAGYQAGVE